LTLLGLNVPLNTGCQGRRNLDHRFRGV